MRLISEFFFLLCYISLPQLTLQLTIAVLTGNNKLDESGNIIADQLTSSSSNIQLETKCQMQSYSNGKIFNCTSEKPRHASPTYVKSGKSLEVTTEKEVKCGLNSNRVGETCVCSPGFKKFPLSDVCVKEEGFRCNFGNRECSPDMTYMACINHVCSCESSDSYDAVSMTCRGKVGGLCYPGIKECVGNAECVNVPKQDQQRHLMKRSQSSYYSDYLYSGINDARSDASMDYVISSNNDIELSGRCECKEGFVESEDGFCKKGYGETCTSSDQCDSLNLVCKEGLCSCPSSVQVYDFAMKSCVALVGAQCLENPMFSMPGAAHCVQNAFCKKTNLRSIGIGRCACVEGAEETKMRTCVIMQQQFQQNPVSDSAEASQTLQSLHQTSLLFQNPARNKGESSSRVLFSDYD